MSGAMVFLLCLVWIIGGCVTGEIASRQGRPFFTWFVAGMLCFVIAFLYLLLSKPSDEILAESVKYRNVHNVRKWSRWMPRYADIVAVIYQHLSKITVKNMKITVLMKL